MEVIFIKDTRENPAYKQIKSITSNYDYVDAYAGHDTINYLSKLPDAPVGAYIYDQRLEGTLQHFELEILSPKDPAHLTRFHFIYMKEDRLDWINWAKANNIHEYVIQFLEDPKNIAYFYGQSVDDVRVRTPKGWEQLSDILKDREDQGLLDDPSTEDRAFIAGVISDQIGYDAGPLFATMIWDSIESIPLSKVMNNEPVNQKLINRFANSPLQKQIITVDSWLTEMKEHNVTFTPQHVANFIAFWETMKSDDAKTKVGYDITENFFVPDSSAPNHIKQDCIANLFYYGNGVYNKPFIDFMDKALSVASIKVS